MPVEVIAAMFSVGGLIAAKGVEISWRWYKCQRERGESADEHQARIILAGIEGGHADREQAVELLQKLMREYKQQAEQCQAEYQALRQAFDEEQRCVAQLRMKVDRLERDLARESKHRERLQQQLVEEYARKPSTPAPPPPAEEHQG